MQGVSHKKNCYPLRFFLFGKFCYHHNIVEYDYNVLTKLNSIQDNSAEVRALCALVHLVLPHVSGPCALRALAPHVPFALHALVPWVLSCFTCIVFHVPCTLHDLMFQLPLALHALVVHVSCAKRALAPRVPHVLMCWRTHVLTCLTICAFVPHLPGSLVALMPLMCHLSQVSHAQHIPVHLNSFSSLVLCLLCFCHFSYLSFFLLKCD